MDNPAEEHQAALADWREKAEELKNVPAINIATDGIPEPEGQARRDEAERAEAAAADAERAARRNLSQRYDQALAAYRADPSEGTKAAYKAAAEALVAARQASRTVDAEVAGRPPGMVVTGTEGGVS